MKIAIVGGSAPSTAALFLTPEFQTLQSALSVTLIGRSPERVEAVARAVRLLRGSRTNIERATDFSALDGASIVVLQARYGGYEARIRDETFPLRYGACGDEGLGAGGLAAAWRSWPQMRDALAAIAERCASALVVIMTAPLGLLVRCARRTFETLNIAGICELPWTTLEAVCTSLGISAEQTTFSYAGVNHLGWFDDISCDGVDLVARYARARRDGPFPSAALIEALRAVPLKYLALHYDRAAALHRQRTQAVRAAELQVIQASAYRALASGDRNDVLAALAARPTPWYSDALAPLIAGLATGNASTVFFLSVPNNGYIPSLPDADILEQPFTIRNSKLQRIDRSSSLRAELLEPLSAFVAYERAAGGALLENDLLKCQAVLAAHPWYRDHREIAALAAAVIAAI